MIKKGKSSTRQQLADAGRKLRQEGVDRKQCWECHAKKCDEERARSLYKKSPAEPADHGAPMR